MWMINKSVTETDLCKSMCTKSMCVHHVWIVQSWICRNSNWCVCVCIFKNRFWTIGFCFVNFWMVFLFLSLELVCLLACLCRASLWHFVCVCVCVSINQTPKQCFCFPMIIFISSSNWARHSVRLYAHIKM